MTRDSCFHVWTLYHLSNFIDSLQLVLLYHLPCIPRLYTSKCRLTTDTPLSTPMIFLKSSMIDHKNNTSALTIYIFTHHLHVIWRPDLYIFSNSKTSSSTRSIQDGPICFAVFLEIMETPHTVFLEVCLSTWLSCIFSFYACQSIKHSVFWRPAVKAPRDV